MKVSQWAEIRRLAEVEGLPQRQIAERLRCCWRTVKKALAMQQPPDETRRPRRGSILDPYKPKIDALITKYPQLSAVRVLEEIRKGPEGYTGQVSVVRRHLRQIRPARGRIYGPFGKKCNTAIHDYPLFSGVFCCVDVAFFMGRAISGGVL